MTVNATIYQEMFMPTPSGITTWWTSTRKVISEEGIIDFVAKLSPWLAPLPSAFFLYEAAISHLHANEPLAWIIAVVIETLGLTTMHTALGMHAWNRAHQDRPDKKAPFGLACVLTGAYSLVALLLIVVLKVSPDASNYAPVMFPFLAIVGAVNLAMRSHHNQRVREERATINEVKSRQRQIEDEDRADRREERRIKLASKYGLTVNQPVSMTINSTVNHEETPENDGSFAVKMTAGKMSKIDGRRGQLLAVVKENPEIELAELQRKLGLGSVNTVKEDIKALVGQGRLVFENRRFEVPTNGHSTKEPTS